jgi:hypothetical protein
MPRAAAWYACMVPRMPAPITIKSYLCFIEKIERQGDSPILIYHVVQFYLPVNLLQPISTFCDLLIPFYIVVSELLSRNALIIEWLREDLVYGF